MSLVLLFCPLYVTFLFFHFRFIVNYEKYFKLSDELRKIETKSDGDHVENIVYIKQVIQSMAPQTLPESKEDVEEVTHYALETHKVRGFGWLSGWGFGLQIQGSGVSVF